MNVATEGLQTPMYSEGDSEKSTFSDIDYDFLKDDIEAENPDIEKSLDERVSDIPMLQKIEKRRQLNFFARNLRLLGAGSIRASVFTLFSGSVGAGVLSLPHVNF